MKRIYKIMRDKKGEGYIDAAVVVFCVMFVIALGVRIFPVFITKIQLDNFADELVREAEISGRVGSETTARQRTLEEKTGIHPAVSWSGTGKIQLNEEVTVTLTLQKDLGLFGKCYQSFKRLLTGQEGSMAPAAVAAAIAMLLIILGVSEYMRLVITAAGIKDAMESAVVSVVNDNYNEVYHGVREGYAAGYEPDDTGFTASVDHGDIYGRMCFLLGLEEDGNSYVRYNNSGGLEYRLKNLSVDIHNTALASPGGTYYADAEVTMEVPVRFAGKILSNMSVRLKVRAAYREKF